MKLPRLAEPSRDHVVPLQEDGIFHHLACGCRLYSTWNSAWPNAVNFDAHEMAEACRSTRKSLSPATCCGCRLHALKTKHTRIKLRLPQSYSGKAFLKWAEKSCTASS